MMDAPATSNNQQMKTKSNICCVLKPTFASSMHMTTSPKNRIILLLQRRWHVLAARSFLLAATLVGLIFLFTRNDFSKHHHTIDFNECGSSIFLPPVSFPIFHFNLPM